MNKKLMILIVVVVLAIGGGLLYNGLRKDDTTKSSSNSMAGMDMGSSSSSNEAMSADTSSAAYKQYAALTGEDYDRMFMANMIAHHEGAVAMAKQAQANAKHQELKDMADNIITAQTSEISNMQSWQQQWGYPATGGDQMMDHSAMGMMDDMASMENELKGKTGDDFDKAFLTQMIMHHQSAINTAAPGAKNAQHQEVKDLTVAIVTAQSKEIKQMKQWQKEWGY